MAKYLKNQRTQLLRNLVIAVLLFGCLIGAYYTVFFKPIQDAAPPEPIASASAAPATVAPAETPPTPVEPPRPVPQRTGGLLAAETPDSQAPTTDTSTATGPTLTPTGADPSRASALMRAGIGALTADAVLDARAKITEALALGLPAAEVGEARNHLTRMADRSIFSSSIIPNDPHVIAYVVQPGETMAKLAKTYAVTSDLLARVNGMTDKNLVRSGQRIKLIRGPFSAVVHSTAFEMEVFLGPTLVKCFRVGLGTDGSTPKGKWKVNGKLVNPTYHPPRGGVIMSPDDPQNPLGERWIGLEGIEGEAVGQVGYGIHGTIEPETIGKNMSLGCVRMLNSDVEFLFDLLVEEQSTVIIR